MDESRLPVNNPSIPGIRRASTLPTSLSNPSPTSSLQGQNPRPQQIETLFTHSNARIVHFSASSQGNITSQPYSTQLNDHHDTDEIRGTLPWRASTERLVAAGPLQIYRVPSSVAFLNVGTSFLKPILAKSQCWCVDGISQFVLKRGPYDFYRIELPGETDVEQLKADEFGAALSEILRYEKTPCPFKRGFHIDLPENPQVTYVPWKPKHQPTPSPSNGIGDDITHDDLSTPSQNRQLTRNTGSVSTPPVVKADRYRSSSFGKLNMPPEDSVFHDSIKPMIGKFEVIDKYHERDMLSARILSEGVGKKRREGTGQGLPEPHRFIESTPSKGVGVEGPGDTFEPDSSLSSSDRALQRRIPRIDAYTLTATTRPASLAKQMQVERMIPEQQTENNDDDDDEEGEEESQNLTDRQRLRLADGIGSAVSSVEKQVRHGIRLSPYFSVSNPTEVSFQVGTSGHREQNDEAGEVRQSRRENSLQIGGMSSEMSSSLSISEDLPKDMQTRVSVPLSSHIGSEEQTTNFGSEHAYRRQSSLDSFMRDYSCLADIQDSNPNKQKADQCQDDTPSSFADISIAAGRNTDIYSRREMESQNTESVHNSQHMKSKIAPLNQPDGVIDFASEEDPSTPFWHSFVESPLTSTTEPYESDAGGIMVPNRPMSATSSRHRASSSLLHDTSEEHPADIAVFRRSAIDTDASQNGVRPESSLLVHHQSQLSPRSYEHIGAMIGEKMAGMVLGPPLRLAALMLYIASKLSEGARIRDVSGMGWKRRGESGRKLPGTWQYYSEDQAIEDDSGEEDNSINDF